MGIENPMVIDDLWDKAKIIGECQGCGEYIFECQEIYEGDCGLLHQNAECCVEYVANVSFCKIAGE